MDREVKEIRIDGDDSDWYSYATFILKPHMTQKQLPNNLLEYADHIIERHLKLNPSNAYGLCAIKKPNLKKQLTPQQLDKKINKFLMISTLALLSSLLFYFVY